MKIIFDYSPYFNSLLNVRGKQSDHQKVYSIRMYVLVCSFVVNLFLGVFVLKGFLQKTLGEPESTVLKKEDFLTPTQLRWLDTHRDINLAHCRGYKPIDFWGRNKKWEGFSADYMNQVFDVLGLAYRDVTGGSLVEKLERVQNREVDLVTSVYEQHVMEGVCYTEPYFKLPIMVFTRAENKEKIKTLDDLKGLVLGISKDSKVQSFFAENYPEIILEEYSSHGTAYLQLSHGAVDACLSTLHSGVNKGAANGVTNVVLVGNTYLNLPYGLAVRDDWSELVEILNLTIEQFEKERVQAIRERWYGAIGPEALFTKRHLSIVFIVGGCFGIILLIFYKRKEILESEREREREVNESKSRFFAAISHDLRHPFAAMLTMLELTGEGSGKSRHKEYIKCALQGSDALLRLLNEILNFSKVEAGALTLYPASHNLRQSILNSVGLYQHTEKDGVSFDVDIKEHQIFSQQVIVDELRLQQVILNLVNNAIKLTDYGVVQLRVAWLTKPQAYSCWNPEDYPILQEHSGYLMIDVIDSGEEIQPEVLERVFSSGSRLDTHEVLKNELGLAISNELITTMGGRIKATTHVAKGNVFSIVLPLTRASTVKHQAFQLPSTIQRSLAKPRKVLVVDDDRLGNMFITNICKGLKCEVDSVVDGKQALERIQLHTYDLVFLDIEMPVMNGIETIQEIRNSETAQGQDTLYVVALTGHEDRDEELRTYGFSEVITKPCHRSVVQELLDRIEKV